jgi:hypothetical protein
VAETLNRPLAQVQVVARAIETPSAALAATSFRRLHHSIAVPEAAAVVAKAAPPACWAQAAESCLLRPQCKELAQAAPADASNLFLLAAALA